MTDDRDSPFLPFLPKIATAVTPQAPDSTQNQDHLPQTLHSANNSTAYLGHICV